MAVIAIHTQFVNRMRRFLILISDGPKLFVELEVSPTLGPHTLDTYLLFVCLFAGLLLQCYRFVTYGNDKLYVISCVIHVHRLNACAALCMMSQFILRGTWFKKSIGF